MAVIRSRSRTITPITIAITLITLMKMILSPGALFWETESEGIKNKLMAEAEGKRASLMAEAEALQQKELAPAMAFEKMVEVAGGRPDLAVQWKTVDHLEGIAGAQAEALSKISLGQVTVYGDASTGGKFVKELMANVTPAIDMISSGMKDPLKNLLGIGKQQNELPSTEEQINEDKFENPE